MSVVIAIGSHEKDREYIFKTISFLKQTRDLNPLSSDEIDHIIDWYSGMYQILHDSHTS
jgi:hypothetical protein